MIRRLLQALLCCLCIIAQAAEMQLVYPRYFLVPDISLEYDWIVLRAALDKTAARFGPYTLKPSGEPLSVPRLLQEMSRSDGCINIIARATDCELEKKFQPIRISIERGLMGMRLLMVRKADLPRFAAVRTLEDLKRLSAGQGKGWIDTEVLAAAGISVVESPRPHSLYGMLEAGPSTFSRVRYPLPRYFFVRRDAQGDRLAARIRAGMELMVQDGTLAALFRQHKGRLVERAAIGRRRIIDLHNPALPPDTPLERSELWFRP